MKRFVSHEMTPHLYFFTSMLAVFSCAQAPQLVSSRCLGDNKEAWMFVFFCLLALATTFKGKHQLCMAVLFFQW